MNCIPNTWLSSFEGAPPWNALPFKRFPSSPLYTGIAQVKNTPEIQENQVQTNFNDFNYKGSSLMIFTVENCKIK